MTRILIIGGYGTFGLRLAKMLSGQPVTLILAGRNLDKASTASAPLPNAAPLRLDRNADLAAQIQTPPDIIVDCSGPFQSYGKQGYRVAEYAISMGAHYFDIADGADFVTGISALDIKAKAAGVSVISGLSTFPCLTSAVVMALSRDMDGVSSVTAGIAPSPHTAMGRSVIGSILSYAGKRVGSNTYGLIDTFRETIVPPGNVPMRSLLFSAVEAPDNRVLEDMLGYSINIRNGAGPQPEFLHRILIGLAKLVKLGLFKNLSWLHSLIYKTQDLIKSGEHRGGMFVKLASERPFERPIAKKWSLIADGDIGPNIPILPVIILIKKILAGDPPKPGAYHSGGVVSLAEYETEFEAHGIAHGTLVTSEGGLDLYPQVLGPAYLKLAAPIQDLHKTGNGRVFSGQAKITRGRNPLSKIIAAIFRFPKAGDAVPVTVSLTREGETEIWLRDFGGNLMRSTQEFGILKQAYLVIERFGPFAINLAVSVKGDQLHLTTRGWSVFGLPLPKSLAPGGQVYEHIDEKGRFNFHVEIKAPLFGLLVKYEGWLMPA